MLLVGLTGNIASGKSLVANALRQRGAIVVDADVLAREAVAPGSDGLAAIRARWGARVIAADGSLDRAALRRIVFADAAEREALNAIVHPEVDRRRARGIAEARAAGARLVVCDIPLLFEKGLEGQFDVVVLVDAPEVLRLARLVALRGLDEAEARAMIAAQAPSGPKRARAGIVIDNDGSLAHLEAQVEATWAALVAKAAE